MFTAICRKNCTFKGKYWEEGEVYKGKAEPPSHFEITERPAEEKGAAKKNEPKNEPDKKPDNEKPEGGK